jgi:superfamily I DNA/RNA helicase
MPHNIPIVLEDIAEVGESLDCDFSDEYRQEALQCKVCRDIQACPGSGKTTLLVAKLAILSKKWRWKDRGICVLSHTNVARKEVERKLADHLTAHHLLSYPHFVGTIQVFVDRFLALPFLRNAGVDVATVGNDRFASRVWTLISEYDYLRTYLNRRPYNARKVLPTLRYEGANLELGSAGGGIPFGEHTATFKELLRLKKRISREGIFRYDDMFAFAEAYLSRYLDLSKVVSERFPWVFVDEMQDTSLIQASLLDRLFTTSVVQRLGDINQAIFEEGDEDTDSQTGFPLSNAISLPQSKRFGPAIASWATNLTVVDYQNIEGRPDCRKRNHTIFLFDADSILQVLPSFGELVSETYSGEVWGEFPIKGS